MIQLFFVCATIWHINNVFYLPISFGYCCQKWTKGFYSYSNTKYHGAADKF